MFDFQFAGWLTPYINDIIKKGAENQITDLDFIRRELNKFMSSPKRFDMIKGYNYYVSKHDILNLKRTAIGPNGELVQIDNLPNNRIVNNQYSKIIDQKVNYLFGKEIMFNTENKMYSKLLNDYIFDAEFDRLIQSIAEDSLNCGIAWLFVGYDENGKLNMRRIKPWQVLPGWADEEHTKLNYAIRVYPMLVYDKKTEKEILKIEVYDKKGITKFIKDGGNIYPDGVDWQVPYFYAGDTGLGWDKIPLIAFKSNRNEQSLLKRVKGLQDALNIMLSNYTNAMEEDVRNTILVLKNYDGENLGEFRRNLATYGAVKVRNIDGSGGGVETLNIEVNSENYKVIIDLLKKAIIENAMGYDAKDDRLSGNANQINIQSMYSDIDLDANKMETEYKASLQKLLWFVNTYLLQTKQGDFKNEKVDIVFNRNILINESEAIDNCSKSQNILSNETVIAQHPWVSDVQAELKKLKKQKEDNIESYGFPISRKAEDKNSKDDD